MQKNNSTNLKLENDSRVAVIGGGPAGSFFGYFLLDIAGRVGLKIHVDIYEPRDFGVSGPVGCNMCGGVIYEALVQSLAVEGINLPTTIVQRGIEYNMLHMDIGSAKIQTPRHEKRIASTFRGSGPRGSVEFKGGSLDGYLLRTAIAKGARHIRGRVDEVKWETDTDVTVPGNRLVQVKSQGGAFQTYDLVAVTAGVNTAVLKLFRDLDFGYQPPRTTKLLVREYHLGEEQVSRFVGPVFHAFLLDIPGLDYGAIIPKGDYVTVCLLSSHGDLEAGMLEIFLNDPAVKRALPIDFSSASFSCHCSPRINALGSTQPFGDRIVFIGDSGISRLYKDGIGAAYRTAKIAASTAVFEGFSERDFRKHYLPFCRKMEFDNRIGKLLFKIIGQIQKRQFARQAVLRMVSTEQQGKANAERGMSMLMWDMLTGGTPYEEVLLRALNPVFWMRFLWNIAASLIAANRKQQGANTPILSFPQEASNSQAEGDTSNIGDLGKLYHNGETIFCQGEVGDCMYVVQAGQVEVVQEKDGKAVRLAIRGEGEFFGEIAIVEREVRMATVRALGEARILTIDKRTFLRRVHEDPSLAYRIVQRMSNRIRELSDEMVRLKTGNG